MLKNVMGAYEYNIKQILMADIVPDASVRRAMNEINVAQRMQLASVFKGEAEKMLLVKRAEAEVEAKYLGGVGVARQRQAITDALRENILNLSHKVEGNSAKEVILSWSPSILTQSGTSKILQRTLQFSYLMGLVMFGILVSRYAMS